jgi:hypothetical protein
MAKNASIITVRPRRLEPVLICKKCLKRAGDGSRLKRALKSELKRRAAMAGDKKPRVVATLKRGDYLLLADADTSAEAAALLIPSKTSEVASDAA